MIKNILLLVSFLFTYTHFWAQSVNIDEAHGWLESAYIKWQPIDSAASYNVYYSGDGVTDKQIDTHLIRDYGTYFRADILGIAAGSYTIKVIPVFTSGEGEEVVSNSVTVLPHDRTGFAFSNERIPGAYKVNGTPKDGALILYITENTKDKVSLIVTGANENPCVGLQEILYGFKKGDDNRPLIIRLIGQITDFAVLDKGDIVIENSNNSSGYITFEGVGNDAVADGWGIRIKNATNIEIRNLGLMNCDSDEGDNIGLQQGNNYIWVHHNDFFYGNAGSASDQAKGDGALDSKKSTYVTHSYNHFWDSGKSNLLGNGDEVVGYFTYHHNWYDHSDSRHPRVREHTVHVYNNYFDGNAKYGIGSTTACSIFAENNYFRKCKYPMLISLQGSDVYGSNDGTFSSDPGGIIKAYGNYIEGETRFVDQNGFTTDFDAYVVDSANEVIPSTVTTISGGHTYNNFDTNSAIMYDYTPDSPEDAKTKVMEYSGRMFGGDFEWTFNTTTDETSSDVNTALKTALTAYQTSLVAVLGDSAVSEGGSTDTTGTDGTGTEITSDVIHNYTVSGLSSSFFNISGNLSDSKGTVNYVDLTMDICLKIESSTSISFTTTEESTLTLVFGDSFSGGIKINGTSHSVSSGILTITLPAGSYEITKDDTCNLYYMSLDFVETSTFNNVSDELSIYTNPTNEIININTNNRINSIIIYNLTGAVIKNIESPSKTIDVSWLHSGSYIVSVSTDKSNLVKKIIKK